MIELVTVELIGVLLSITGQAQEAWRALQLNKVDIAALTGRLIVANLALPVRAG
jgi:hypothetical protein